MANKITEIKIMQVLDWAYEKAINGVTGLDSASELAADYMKRGGSLIDQTNSLIRWQNTKAGTAGFLSGLGGVFTLPVTVSANFATVIYVQIRMIAAIAHMGQHDLNDDRVKSLVYACLLGNSDKDILKNAGVVAKGRFAESLIKSISGEAVKAIKKAVCFRLLTKFSETGIINLGKAVPLVGGILGASFDTAATNAVGNIARKTFIERNEIP